MRAEIEEHLALQTADNIRAGLSPAEARRQAVLKFGAVEAIKERYRDQRGLPSVETLIQDTRHALRRLRMAPAFTIATVLTLALGIGATTSIFTLVHAVLLKSLPVANPGELYRLGKDARCCYLGGYSPGQRVLPGLVRSLQIPERQHQGLFRIGGLSIGAACCLVSGGRAAPSRPKAIQASSSPAITSRCSASDRTPVALLTPTTIEPGAPPVAVMSYRLWQRAVRGGSVRYRQRVQC